MDIVKMVDELLELEEKLDHFFLTSYERREFQNEVMDRIISADRKTEPQTMVYPQVDGITPSVIAKTEPQTDKEIILDPSFAELSDEQFAEAMKLIVPQTDIGTSDTVYSDTAGYVPRADMTDCSWKKGE